MKFYIDLHIHSGLSPCGDEDMTPNNIVNMAYIKGLDIIAVTDHNSMENVEAVVEAASNRNILVIPGMEVTTREEIHVLCYFKTLIDGLKFQKEIYKGLPNINNKEDVFGRQIVYDSKDNVKGKIKKLLINSTSYTIEEINQLTLSLNGIMIPAHIDKKSFSILSVLGFIPPNLKISTLEISNKDNFNKIDNLVNLNKYNIIQNSDAHYLQDISEPNFYFDLPEKNIDLVFEMLSSNRL